MARTYKRDSRGRFAGGGGSGGGRPATRKVQRGTNRLTRDNSGRITGTGDGATARGGRLRTAGGKQRGKVMAKGTKRAAGAGMIRKSDVERARMDNSTSKNIERRNKSGENPPWAGRENSGSRLRRAKARIAQQKRKPSAARSGSAPARPIQGDRLKRATARAQEVMGRSGRIRQAISTTDGSPVLMNMRYSAARSAGQPLRGRELSKMSKAAKSYSRAMRSEAIARKALDVYAKAKPAAPSKSRRRR